MVPKLRNGKPTWSPPQVAGKTYDSLCRIASERGGGFALLIDPDRQSLSHMTEVARQAEKAGVDAIFVGSSLVLGADFSESVAALHKAVSIPIILFPGGSMQVAPEADAILFLSLASGRNPEWLIGEQVRGAPAVYHSGIEVIPTAYLLINGGKPTSVQYMSQTIPIPDDKPDIAVAHALAVHYMGMRLLFLEAGSGAERSVPEELISAIHQVVPIPMVVGGGIRDAACARAKILAGASWVVVGNFFESDSRLAQFQQFAQAVHLRENPEVPPRD